MGYTPLCPTSQHLAIERVLRQSFEPPLLPRSHTRSDNAADAPSVTPKLPCGPTRATDYRDEPYGLRRAKRVAVVHEGAHGA